MAQLEINKIYCGDCIRLLQENTNIKPRHIFADPSFTIGYEYEIYNDNLAYDHYVGWTQN
jgi:hypothetical protein